MRTLALLFALVCGACTPLRAPVRRPNRVVRLFALGQWDSDNARVFREALASARRAGLDAREVPRGTPGAVRIEHAIFSLCEFNGTYDATERLIQIDPVCASPFTVRRSVILHEILHAFGARHVCQWARQLPDTKHPGEVCSPVGEGESVLTPYTPRCGDDPDASPFEHAVAGCAALDEATDLDRAELRRVGAL